MSAARLPGSMYAIATRKPGPTKRPSILRKLKERQGIWLALLLLCGDELVVSILSLDLSGMEG